MIVGILIGAYAIIALLFLYVNFADEERFTPGEFLWNIVSAAIWLPVLLFGLLYAMVIGIKQLVKE